MNKDTRSKMTRQLQIYYRLSSSEIIGPNDLMQEFDISRRMLQRDLKDIRDCGLLNAKLDRSSDSYITDKDALFDETTKDRRRQHLIKLNRIGTLIWNLSQTDPDELHMYETLLEEYEDALHDSQEAPDQFPPDDVPDKPDKPDMPDLKAEYYALFPDSNERTRQRDFEEMNHAGFHIYYNRKHKSFIYEYDY